MIERPVAGTLAAVLPDFCSQDSAGRDISHFMVDGFVFDFWVDHPAKQVIITDIDFVE